MPLSWHWRVFIWIYINRFDGLHPRLTSPGYSQYGVLITGPFLLRAESQMGPHGCVSQLIIYISARSRILLRSPEDETILILRVVPLYSVNFTADPGSTWSPQTLPHGVTLARQIRRDESWLHFPQKTALWWFWRKLMSFLQHCGMCSTSFIVRMMPVSK